MANETQKKETLIDKTRLQCSAEIGELRYI